MGQEGRLHHRERPAWYRLCRRGIARRNHPPARLRCVAHRQCQPPPTASQATAALGTLDWMFAEYRADRRYTKLDTKSKRKHEAGFKLVGGYILKDGKRL